MFLKTEIKPMIYVLKMELIFLNHHDIDRDNIGRMTNDKISIAYIRHALFKSSQFMNRIVEIYDSLLTSCILVTLENTTQFDETPS